MRSGVWVIKYHEPRPAHDQHRIRVVVSSQVRGACLVVATDGERALELFRDAHPDAQLHKLDRLSVAREVLIDPCAAET